MLRPDNAVHLTMFGWSSSFNTATSRIMWLGTPSSSLSILSFFSVMMSPVTRCRACGAEENHLFAFVQPDLANEPWNNATSDAWKHEQVGVNMHEAKGVCIEAHRG